MKDSGNRKSGSGGRLLAKPGLDLAPEFVKFAHLFVAFRQFFFSFAHPGWIITDYQTSQSAGSRSRDDITPLFDHLASAGAARPGAKANDKVNEEDEFRDEQVHPRV